MKTTHSAHAPSEEGARLPGATGGERRAPLIVITGATACGKTKTAVELAKRIGGEVVSADSMLIYRGMDIGTAKPTAEECESIPHHMIDVADPDEAFSAARYQHMAAAVIADIHARGAVPILAGGTGFYINAVVYGNEFEATGQLEEDETAYRRALQELAAVEGADRLHTLLKEVDPASAEAIHPNNVKRVARALSFYRFTGRRISKHNAAQRAHAAVYDLRFFVLDWKREALYRRIDARVTRMYEMGLTEEVIKLLDTGYGEGLTSMQGIGYKETVRYIRGHCTFEEMTEAVRVATRHYAKRQLTWLKGRAPDAVWLDANSRPARELAEAIAEYHI